MLRRLSTLNVLFRTSGLQALEIVGWNTHALRVSLVLHCLGPSLGTVTRLKLEHILVHPQTLTTFISHFPCLNYLSIFWPGRPPGADGAWGLHHSSPGGVVPTRPHGEFRATDVSVFTEKKEFFNSIVLLELRFHKIFLEGTWCDGWRDFWPLLEVCSGSLEELIISGCAECM